MPATANTILQSPTSRRRAGVGRVDITPPVGIYHRLWGAARHDCAEGVHRPLTATAFVLGPTDGSGEDIDLFVALDHCMLRPPDMDELLGETSARTGLAREQITFAFSHTHAAGNLCRARAEMPGGNLIGPYLDALPEKIAEACCTARQTMAPVVVTYAHSSVSCNLGQSRDFCGAAEGTSEPPRYLCGLNPHAIGSLPVTVARFCDAQGRIIATLVNYACHPTTLAWDNRLISPDYVGAMRETVECVTGGLCLFFLAPCGDIGPEVGFVGEPVVADKNGRQLGYAALSALESLAPPGTDYQFAGAVLSGATIGTWVHRLHSDKRRKQTDIFRKRRWSVPLPYREDLPSAAEGRRRLEKLLATETAARRRGNFTAETQKRALVERERRLLERIEPLPPGKTYPFPIVVWQAGDAFWIAIEGEPYHALQESLQHRFPRTPLVLVTLANGIRPSYLPRRADYEQPWYEVDIALLAPGALEALTDEIARQIATWSE